jgi:hypothetical protein
MQDQIALPEHVHVIGAAAGHGGFFYALADLYGGPRFSVVVPDGLKEVKPNYSKTLSKL